MSSTVPSKKILSTFYRQATNSVAYWRCELPAKYLPGKVMPLTEMEVRRRPDRTVEFVDLEGVAVFQFPGQKQEAGAALLLQAEGHRLFVETDDNYLDATDPLWRARSQWGDRIGSSVYSTQGHRWIVEQADGVLVTGENLARAYREHNDNVHICRNSIDPDDWPELQKPGDGVFRIGWYASLSHDRDAPLVRKALSWASRQPNVEVVTIGLDPTGWDFRKTHFPFEHHVSLRNKLMLLDVGVAPIMRAPMAKGRSDLKILEMAMGGAMTIASAEPAYEAWRPDEMPALLAATDKEFERHIRWAVKNQDEARDLARRAREYVLEHRTFRTEIEAWRNALVPAQQLQEAA